MDVRDIVRREVRVRPRKEIGRGDQEEAYEELPLRQDALGFGFACGHVGRQQGFLAHIVDEVKPRGLTARTRKCRQVEG